MNILSVLVKEEGSSTPLIFMFALINGLPESSSSLINLLGMNLLTIRRPEHSQTSRPRRIEKIKGLVRAWGTELGP